LHDRIPNFAGAEEAARRLTELPEWQAARRIKCNPDAPQRAVRLAALRQGKTVVMAVPRLRTERCFVRLDPRALQGKLAQAATIKGASALGVPVLARQIGRIDLVVAGSVAIDETGARLGKGGGYSDLEFALARSLGAIGDDTPVVTTVHELQVLGEAIPMTAHDVPLDVVVTPERVIRVRRRYRKPSAIIWKELSAEQLAQMPALARLARKRPRRARSGG
jgi:5-formyltetrahydrofolate cyclo-ligase